MAVPEAPVDEDRLFPADENDVGCPGKTASMQTISKALGVQQTANNEFRLRILLLDARHKRATCRRGVRRHSLYSE